MSAVKSGCAASFFSVALTALSGLPCIAITAWVVASRTRVTANAADSPSTTKSSGTTPACACDPAPCNAQSSICTGPEEYGLVIWSFGHRGDSRTIAAWPVRADS